MEAFRLVLLSLAILCAGSLVFADDAANNSSTTLKPSTSTVISTTSTVGPTKPSNVTEHDNATTTNVVTTAHSSTLTVTHAPSTVPTTPPVPKDVWTAKGNGTYCILLQATFTMTFTYNSTEHKIVTDETGIHKPPNADVKSYGDCLSNAKQQNISLSFFDDSWVLTLEFTHGNDSSYSVTGFNLKYDLRKANFSNLPSTLNETVTESHNVKDLFKTSKAGFTCTTNQTMYKKTSTDDQALIRIDVRDLKLEAFRKKETATFDQNNLLRCQQDEISNLVPIIVGACLGGLILIVLVAYLIGRRRSRRGYESV